MLEARRFTTNISHGLPSAMTRARGSSASAGSGDRAASVAINGISDARTERIRSGRVANMEISFPLTGLFQACGWVIFVTVPLVPGAEIFGRSAKLHLQGSSLIVFDIGRISRVMNLSQYELYRILQLFIIGVSGRDIDRRGEGRLPLLTPQMPR